MATWYRMRALRTFRDKTSLSITVALWPSIDRDLAASRYLIVLRVSGGDRLSVGHQGSAVVASLSVGRHVDDGRHGRQDPVERDGPPDQDGGLLGPFVVQRREGARVLAC